MNKKWLHLQESFKVYLVAWRIKNKPIAKE